MATHKVTIAIPAYNRPHTLTTLLEGLVKSITDDFFIVVCDDASPDREGMNAVVEKFKNNPNISFYRNEVNLGFSGNVLHVYELSTTEYVWFMCDDDVVYDTAPEAVLLKLEKFNPTVAVFNHTQTDPYDRTIKAYYGEKDLVFNSPDEISDYSHLLRINFLSTLVVKKMDVANVIHTVDYTDNVFVQVTLALQLLSRSFKYTEFPDVILHRNVGFKYGEFYKFYMVDHLKSVYLLDHVLENSRFIRNAIKSLPTALKLFLSQKLGLFSYKGEPTTETIALMYKFYGRLAFFMLLFPKVSMLTPTYLLKFIYFMQLVMLHGLRKAQAIYSKNINRAFTDARKTGFHTYK